MRGLLRRTAVLAGAVALALSSGTGIAGASTRSSPLAFTPSARDYGEVRVGHAMSRAFLLSNTSDAAVGALTVTVKGSADFAITFTTCGASLGPGRRCLILVRFAPASSGAISAHLTAASESPAAEAAARLTGTGVETRCSGTPAQAASGTGKSSGGARLYWADGGRGTIMAAHLDGSDPTTLVTGQDDPVGVAADSGHIYWADYGGDLICEANPDGSGATELARGPSPAGVAVDVRHVYWAESLNFGSIRRASLENPGGAADTLVYPQHRPFAMAVDRRHIYWTNVFEGTLMRANLDGGDITELVSRDADGGVAVTGNRIYWTNSLDTGGRIMAANLDGRDVTTLVKDQRGPLGIAVYGHHIYWTNGASGTLMRASLDGGHVTTLVTGQDRPAGIAVGPQVAPAPPPAPAPAPPPVPVTG